MASVSAEKQLEKTKADLRAVTEKLEVERQRGKDSVAAANASGVEVERLRKDIAAANAEITKLKAKGASDAKSARAELDSYADVNARAEKAEADLKHLQSKGDVADGRLEQQAAAHEEEKAALRAELKDLQVRLFNFREAVRGL